MSKIRHEPKPKVAQTVWKKKNAVQKAMETSGQSTSSEAPDINTSVNDQQSSPIIGHISGTVQQKHSDSVYNDSGTLTATEMGVPASHQQLLLLNNQLMSQSTSHESSLQTLQSAMTQVPVQSSPVHSGSSFTQLQQSLQDFTPISFPSQQSNMHLQVTQENLNAFQQVYPYVQQPDLGATLHHSLTLNGYPGSSVGSVAMQQGLTDPHTGQVLTGGTSTVDLDGNAAEGTEDVHDALHMNDFQVADGNSDSDLDESSEQDMSFEIKVGIYSLMHFNPFPKKPWVFTCLQYNCFENTVGKGEIAHNEHFLLFPECFQPVRETFCYFI